MVQKFLFSFLFSSVGKRERRELVSITFNKLCRKRAENVSEIDLWSEVPGWEDEDGCFNGTMFDYTFQKKLYLQVQALSALHHRPLWKPSLNFPR